MSNEGNSMMAPSITKVTVNIGVGEGGPVSYTHLTLPTNSLV